MADLQGFMEQLRWNEMHSRRSSKECVEACHSATSSVLALAFILSCGALSAEPVAVRHIEGTVRGFLALRTLEGATLATGDLVQVVHGDRLTSHLVFRFKDGSIDDETTVYSQRGVFRLISNHHVQKGPSFPNAMDLSIDTSTGQVTVRSIDKDGKEQVTSDHLDLPTDLANGLVSTLLKNIPGDAPETKVSFVASTPKARLVKLKILPGGEESFYVKGSRRRAMRYVVKVEIGGVAGMVAPLVGKQPQDTQIWILGGEAPAFLRSQGPTHIGGPVWVIELTSPVWPRAR